MKVLRYVLLALVMVLCLTIAMANRDPVTLALWPDTLTAFLGFGYSLTAPLFLIVGGAVGAGLVLGLVWEWLRERGMRAEGARARRELDKVRAGQAPAQAAAPGAAPRDTVLAILDDRDD